MDEIHRLPRALEETFYPAMEDGVLPITVGQGAGARVVTLPLPPFTLIGATTRTGLLTTPLRDRFGIQHRLEHYGAEDLARIVMRSAALLGVEIEGGGAEAIARRSRGTPRVANRLLKRVRDYAEVRHGGVVTAEVAASALDLLEVDDEGLDRLDREILRAICERFGGGPVGLSTLAVAVGEEAGHDRGRLRALSAPARPPRAHPAGARGHAPRLRPPRARRARSADASLVAPHRRRQPNSGHRRDLYPGLEMSHERYFICPHCGQSFDGR